MRTRAIAIILLTLLLGVVFAHPMAQGRQPGKISPGLRARVASGARVPVVIELRAQPDDAPDLPRARAEARGIARAQESFLIRTPGYGHIKRLTSLPIVAIEVDERVLADLEADPDVVSVTLDERRKPSLMTSVPLIGAPTAWSLGASGLGWAVAVLDTGVAKQHPFLVGKVVSEACYGTNTADTASMCPGAVESSTADGSGLPCPANVIGCNHGTHIAGIAAGHSSTLSGVARDGSIIAIKIFSRIDDPNFCFPDASPCAGAFDSDILAGLDRVYELRTQLDIAAVNLSLGDEAPYTGNCDADEPAYKTAIDLLRSVDIATVIASGNGGSTSTMGVPACISSAVAIGASTKADVLALYTSRSSLLALLAPGSNIYSSVPGGGFATLSGTSMAAAHVAGAWAVLKSWNPTASVTEVLTALTSTGLPIADAANARTWPRIRVGDAVNSLPQGPPAVTLIASPDLPQPANVPITWTAHAVGGTSGFEYKFWVDTGGIGTWTLLRDYSTTPSIVWTPTVPGTYAVRVSVRRLGSSADFDAELSSGNFTIISELPTLLSLTADHASPLFANVPVTWTAQVRGGTGPLEYQFWRVDSETNTPTLGQDYSPANTFTWTPGPTDGGSFHVQVRVRAIGSGVPYQALLDSDTFDLLGLTNFTLNSQPGDFIGHGQHIARSDAGATMTLQTLSGEAAYVSFQTSTPSVSFWDFHFAAKGGQVLIPGIYNGAKRWPQPSTVPGLHVSGNGRACNSLFGRFIVLDVEQVNDQYTRFAADFEQHCNGNPVALFGSVRFHSAVPPSERPVKIQSFKRNAAVPKVGVPMTWTATAIGGGPPLQYKFVLLRKATNTTTTVQDGPSNVLVWTPQFSGNYTLQVWVRSTNSQAPYEALAGSGLFTVMPGPVQITAFSADTAFPAPVGTPITWTAAATGGSGNLEYQFWRSGPSTNVWTLVQTYSALSTFTWQPTAGEEGTYAVQVRVRSVGSGVAMQASRSIVNVVITAGP
jgi:hypothetical protein